MFSEYASKFLSQSQSRLSLGQPEPSFTQRSPSRNYQQRRNMNPYASQALSRFAFASRTSNAPAPLFYSATDDFREEDDHHEHDREIADHLALQRSRRQFGASNLSESSEVDDDMERRSDHTIDGGSVEGDTPGYGLGRGIKSSWRGDKPEPRGRSATTTRQEDLLERDQSVPLSESSSPSSKGIEQLVDVELASTMRGSMEELERDEIVKDMDSRPPSYQSFRSLPKPKRGRSPLRTTLPIPQETEEDALLEQQPRPMSPDRETVPEQVAVEPITAPRYNVFFAELFVIAQCAIVGIYLISLLQDSPPDRKLGDTIYTVLQSSFRLIGIYSLVSIVVGLLWLSLLRSFARPLIMLILVAVPVISFSFFLYPLIWSFKGSLHGNGAQDKAMRWLSFGPLLFMLFWIYTVWKGRHSLHKATAMLEFCGDILKAQYPLMLVGIGTLAGVIIWSWIWMSMFAHLFLGGHFNKSKTRWIIDPSTWWLGAAFFLDYFWVLGVIAGIQRSTTAATVSQWYFHRRTVPAPSARTVVYASLKHATSTMAGTICLSTLLSLMVRLPLIVLPRRIAGMISMCAYQLVPSPIASLTNPLTLTYASIHGMALSPAARGLSSMTFIAPSSPTTTLGPRSFAPSHGRQSIVSYRLAKLLLHAIRWVITLALGFGGWVSTARMLQIGNDGVKGSVYAYVVGLISAAIGWGALGAMEGVLSGILDAVLVCWGSEVGPDGRGDARYCVEAGQLFEDEVPGRGRGRYDV
ncbi:hypothetical protein BU24DRAFT_422857 [Aaosphaeria arxii CBS 175.79]|uniref:Protein PNS1 n=1 Tax=Aaosphaeria arxii CBS 175.79 TaxID=1450172 RepID=A0A6A5XTJ6_9PLEO|nr:uncharacterized protein BU24DRAFT_422857 [Aaosphaeria arxii CBS 175.79]KAF2016512.1 hypothetical protein BU24DRAFT_422857 [Aaosphaeria arxii CBS 175.79]